jgi:hypothetical protein
MLDLGLMQLVFMLICKSCTRREDEARGDNSQAEAGGAHLLLFVAKCHRVLLEPKMDRILLSADPASQSSDKDLPWL